MRTKVKNILSGMKLFVQNALEKREEHFVRAQSFTRRRTLDFNKLKKFLDNEKEMCLLFLIFLAKNIYNVP